jgi:hypothetical protein
LGEGLTRTCPPGSAARSPGPHQLLEGFRQIADAAFDVDDLDAFLDRLLRIFMQCAPSIDSVAILLREGDQLTVRAAIGLD